MKGGGTDPVVYKQWTLGVGHKQPNKQRRHAMVKIQTIPGAVMIAYIAEDGTVIEATDMEGRPIEAKAEERIVGSKLCSELLATDLTTRELTATVRTKAKCCWGCDSSGYWVCKTYYC
jgi:hypothetical protein